MIEWKKFDPDDPPEKNIEYFIFSGGRAWVAQFNETNFWVDGYEFFSHVTHYAEIKHP